MDGVGAPPQMLVFAQPDETDSKSRRKIQDQVHRVSLALRGDNLPLSPELLAGTHWFAGNKSEDSDKTNSDDSTEEQEEKKQDKSAKQITAPLIDAATWSVLDPMDGHCSSPETWLDHDFAKVAADPVVVPPLTDAVLDYWSATTDARGPHLSPHPFLYGLADDDEGTPLVGVAFRLEIEALREAFNDDDDPEIPDISDEVLEIFERFPPLRAELHQIKLSRVREWLASTEAEQEPLIYRTRDKWRAKKAGESTSEAARALGPNNTLILSAIERKSKVFDSLMKECWQTGEPNTAISDVLHGISIPVKQRYLRNLEPKKSLMGSKGAWRWAFNQEEFATKENNDFASNTDGYKRSLLKKLRIDGTEYTFRYFLPCFTDSGLQFLDDHNGTHGHVHRAKQKSIRVADAIAPGDAFLRTLLSHAAQLHDEGKRHLKWQRAFGRPKGGPELAKLSPELGKPGLLHGFRHEWESLRRVAGDMPTPPPEIPLSSQTLWQDLLLHLIGVHHGHLRPSIADTGLTPDLEVEKQNSLRQDATERFIRLQSQLGRWRLAYLEALLKTADAEGSRMISESEDEPDAI